MRSLTVFVGTGVSLSGNAINEGVGTIQGRPAVLVEQAMSNHFSDALRLRFTGSLGLDYNKEVFATFAYGKHNGTHVSHALSDKFEVGAEVGLRYQTKPGGEPLFTDPKLAGVNDTGSRWSLPISAFAKARF